MIGFCAIYPCLLCLCLSMAGSAAMAQTSPAMVEKQITSQGYEVIVSETTWLGRLRILAVRENLLREIVIGPGTGEVLRDVVYEIPGLAKAIANARIGPDGRRIVDLKAKDVMGSAPFSLTDSVVVGIGSPTEPQIDFPPGDFPPDQFSPGEFSPDALD
jgi:hypothetical protein